MTALSKMSWQVSIDSQTARWVLGQEVISLLSIHNWTKIYHGIPKQLLGPGSSRLLNTLYANLKKLQRREEYIGSVQWSLRLRSLLSKCKNARLGWESRARILSDVRELLFRLQSIVVRMNLVSTVIVALNTECRPLRDLIASKYTGRLSKHLILVRQLNLLNTVLLEISSYIMRGSYALFERSTKRLRLILAGIGNSTFQRSIKQYLKGIPCFCMGLVTLAKLVLPYLTFKTHVWSAISTMLRKYRLKQMDSYLMICLSNTGHAPAVSTSWTSNMMLHYQRDMLPPQYGRAYPDSSPLTRRLRMFSTSTEITDKSLAMPFGDVRRDIVSSLHSLYRKRILSLDTGTSIVIADAQWQRNNYDTLCNYVKDELMPRMIK